MVGLVHAAGALKTASTLERSDAPLVELGATVAACEAWRARPHDDVVERGSVLAAMPQSEKLSAAPTRSPTRSSLSPARTFV